jgi:hypothetical protein
VPQRANVMISSMIQIEKEILHDVEWQPRRDWQHRVVWQQQPTRDQVSKSRNRPANHDFNHGIKQNK